MSDITERALAYDDPRRQGRSHILYDARNGGYSSQGVSGSILCDVLALACITHTEAELSYQDFGDGTVPVPGILWQGWRITLIDADGRQVIGDTTVYHSMFFVWEPLDELFCHEGEEEPDQRTPAEEVSRPLVDSDAVERMLNKIERRSTGVYSHGSAPTLRRVEGFKADVFRLIDDRGAWVHVTA